MLNNEFVSNKIRTFGPKCCTDMFPISFVTEFEKCAEFRPLEWH